jgi:hypothetical protein
MAELVFKGSYTIDDFKKKAEVSEIEILDAGKGKFFSTPIGGGPCAKKIDIKKPLMISIVNAGEDDFFLMHNKGEGAKTIAIV